jgi:hypothetical protein
MAKLSEILDLPEDKRSEFHFGVEVDCESFTPPPGLKSIAFMLAGSGEGDAGEIDDTLMDVITSYALAGVEITLEVPFEAAGVEPKYFLSVAANAGFSLSLLPPCEDTKDSRAAYAKRLCDFADAYFAQGNFARFLSPVTSYLEYLFVAELADVSEFQPKDPYIKARFVDAMAPDFSDEFKDILRAHIHGIFGGEAEFHNFAKAMIAKIYDQTESNARDMLAAEKAGAEAPPA